MEVSSCENHLFLWAMASMAMLNNQRVVVVELWLTLVSYGLMVDNLVGGLEHEFHDFPYLGHNNPK